MGEKAVPRLGRTQACTALTPPEPTPAQRLRAERNRNEALPRRAARWEAEAVLAAIHEVDGDEDGLWEPVLD